MASMGGDDAFWRFSDVRSMPASCARRIGCIIVIQYLLVAAEGPNCYATLCALIFTLLTASHCGQAND